MNVALIMERVETWRGGAETSTMLFARHLSSMDCRVTILTNSDAQSLPGIQIVPMGAGGSLRSLRTSQFSRRAAKYVAENPFDVVHAITPCVVADVYQPRGGTLPETLERNRAIRSASASRGLKRVGQRFNLKYRALENLERNLLCREPRPWAIAISQYVADQLVRHYGFPSSRIRVIFNGVDPDLSSSSERAEHRVKLRRQLGLTHDDQIALCVAHNFKLKGVARLIDAMNLLQGSTADGTSGQRGRKHLYAVVVGRDNLTPYVRQAQRLGVENRVLFSGPTRRIDAFFHAADFLVHPTYYDPASRVVLEAMAAGLPVITTRFNGAAEKITTGREGFVIDSPADLDGLVQAMAALCEHKRQRMMGVAALQAVAGLTMESHARQVRALYADIVAERGR
jgi:UDP-glucose:(heptosyl)LPS alpha-1,3-glucosyltransferase